MEGVSSRRVGEGEGQQKLYTSTCATSSMELKRMGSYLLVQCPVTKLQTQWALSRRATKGLKTPVCYTWRIPTTSRPPDQCECYNIKAKAKASLAGWRGWGGGGICECRWAHCLFLEVFLNGAHGMVCRRIASYLCLQPNRNVCFYLSLNTFTCKFGS